jgi:hypothetical protein
METTAKKFLVIFIIGKCDELQRFSQNFGRYSVEEFLISLKKGFQTENPKKENLKSLIITLKQNKVYYLKHETKNEGTRKIYVGLNELIAYCDLYYLDLFNDIIREEFN